MVEIGEVASVYGGHVGEYLTCPSFILQRPTANKTSGAPSYSRWSSSQPHQVICPCQKGYEAQVDTCFLLKWICEGIRERYLPALAQLGHAGLWGCCRISCGKLLDAVAAHRGACTPMPPLMHWCLSGLLGILLWLDPPILWILSLKLQVWVFDALWQHMKSVLLCWPSPWPHCPRVSLWSDCNDQNFQENLLIETEARNS